jgi:hypothetical protein
VSFIDIRLYVTSQRVFIVDVYFVIDSVRKLLDTLSYLNMSDFSTMNCDPCTSSVI